MGAMEPMHYFGRMDSAGFVVDRLPRAALYAAIDLGTHNCRMLVARPDRTQVFRVIRSFSRAVRLGEGLAASGTLAEAAIERAIGALKTCADSLQKAKPRRIRSIATEPCRRAGNAAAFVHRVASETGLALESVTAADEAGLTLAGCRPLLDPRFPRVLLFDIGGGSTEVSWIEQRRGMPARMLGFRSLPYGVVSFAEEYGGDRMSQHGYRAIVASVDALLAPLEAQHGISREIAAGRVQMIGTSGTVTTLGAAYLQLKRYERTRVDGLVIGFDDIAAISAALSVTDWAARAANPCIGPDRADLVVAGCAILEAVCRRWPVGRLRIADRGIREGLLMEMMAADRAVPTQTP
jgi:exopolyphosphatase / guanosine-5'-triphosphate,3'-diphosphate pyrophosphatase